MTARAKRSLALAAAIPLVVGCAQSGPMFAQRTKVGTLKTSLAHLEFQNVQLRKQTELLKAENRQVEDQLVQLESLNGDLAARLDDARNVISRRGDEIPENPPRTLPAGRSSRTRRKPPFAQIPGRIDVPKPDDSDEIDPFDSSSIGGPNRRPYDARDRDDDRDRWLPVASDDDRTPLRFR